MAIVIAIFLMLLGGIGAAICLVEILPKIFHIIALGFAVYVFALGAVGFCVETGRIDPQTIQRRTP